MQSDNISINATDTIDNDISAVNWGYSPDNVCDGTDSYPNSFTPTSTGSIYDVSFSVSSESNNGKYVCVKVTDTNPGTSYFISAHPLLIDVTPPTLILSTTSTNPTNTNPIPVTAQFDEDVTGFSL